MKHVCFSVIADRVGADITVLREQEVEYDFDVSRKIAEVLIRKVPDDQQVSDSIVKLCFFQIVAYFFILICAAFPFLPVLGPASGCPG